MSGWRVWLAFEVRPGITRLSDDRTELYKALRESCRGPSGKVDVDEYCRWLDLFIERSYYWARA